VTELDSRSASPDPELSADHPEAYIARDRRRALAAGVDLPDRVSGSALFADISGFTPLTEALTKELGPQRGAEELTVNIGRVFHAVIGELDEFGGDVIYFAGDAITCWIDGDDGTLACAAAMAMQAAIERTGKIVTPAGTEVRLAMKVAVAVGAARRFVVGDPEIQLIDVLAGRLMDDLAAAEHSAEKGDVILEQSAVERLGDRVTLGERREDHDTERLHAVLERLNVPAPRSPVVEPPPLPEDLVRPWLLPAVYERLRTGRGEFLTELRPAIPVFLKFSGIDYDADADAVGKLDEFVRGAQKILTSYGGNVLQLTLGDKGAYLYGVFGSPIAHEDDAARAAAAAIELRDLEKTMAARNIQIGVTRGTLRSGTYGHRMRRTFVCLGDEVNLSARLMAAAPAHRIYVSERIQQGAGDSFIWERLPDMQVKGKAQPVPVYALNGSLERASRRKTRFELRLVGRRQELAMLQARLADATAGRGRILGLAAEAGMGKSRLVAEFVRSARRRGHLVAFGECQAFGTNTAYFVFREIWRRLLLLEDDDPEAAQVAQLQAQLARIDPALVARAPLLDAVLGLSIPDSDLTRSFDARLRKASLEDLLATCLAARSRDEPLVIVLEDCHWIDELSLDLLRALARACASLRVLFVLAYRPTATRGGDLGLESLPSFDEIALERLDDEDAAAVVRSKLQQVLGPNASASDELARLVTDRADGNPLYIEELISYVAGRGIDPSDPDAVRSLQLPESLHTIVLSRIDTIAEAPRRTMKVASVVGRVFRAPMLPGAYGELGSLKDVRDQLETLRAADLVGLEREGDLSYLFKHVVTQEVAYDSMPFSLRTVLHRRLGAYIEASEPDAIERNLDLLAHHFWHGDDAPKKREYLGRAAAAAQASYANAAAIDYYDRLLTLVEGAARVDPALQLAEVLQLTGDVPRAEALVVSARELALAAGDARRIARCDHSLAESARRLGRFDDAAERLLAARTGFGSIGDEAGVAEALQVTGTVNAQRGNLADARAAYESSLAIRARLGDEDGAAGIINNLGIVAQHEGDLERARELMTRALEMYTALGNRRRLSSCEINLAWLASAAGDHETAIRHGEEAIRLAREVGDRLNVAIAHNNLGDALRDQGRLVDAGTAYAAAIEAYRDLGNPGPLMALFEDVAVLLAKQARHADAFRLLGAADALREALGSSRLGAAETELDERLSLARASVGEAEAARARAAGASLSRGDAIEMALLSVREDPA
jgi:class 3 adenylate cyclase/tetratricopeptide (TPR) repeat protein